MRRSRVALVASLKLFGAGALFRRRGMATKRNLIMGSISFKRVADTLASKGHSMTAKQCEYKWKALKKKYREVSDHNKKSGNDR